MELPFVLFDLALGILVTREERQRRRRRREQVASTLERVAEALAGRVVRPWWGRLRVEGVVDGRSVRVEWLGRGRVSVIGPAPEVVGVGARRRTWWLERLLARVRGRGEIEVWGTSASRHDAARRFVGRGEVERVEVGGGVVAARATTGTSAGAILAVVEGAMDLAWSVHGPAASVPLTVTPAAPRPQVTPAPAASASLRCPFCHDGLSPEAVVVHCASCDAPHHPSCFEEGAGCAIAGCAQRAARGVRARAPDGRAP